MFDTATILVPRNGFFLLRQIIYNHFCDTTGEEDSVGEILTKSIHFVTLNEKNTQEEIGYCFRSPVTFSDDGDGKMIATIPGPPTIVETFKIFTQDVCIDISRVPDMQGFAQTLGKMSVPSEERTVPIGYGVGAGGVDVIGFNQFPAPDNGKYFPNGNTRTIGGTTPGGARYRDQFRNPMNSATVLNPAAGLDSADRQNVAPFISFGMWQITGDPSDFIK